MHYGANFQAVILSVAKNLKRLAFLFVRFFVTSFLRMTTLSLNADYKYYMGSFSKLSNNNKKSNKSPRSFSGFGGFVFTEPRKEVCCLWQHAAREKGQRFGFASLCLISGD